MRSSLPIIQYLIKKGANFEAKDKFEKKLLFTGHVQAVIFNSSISH